LILTLENEFFDDDAAAGAWMGMMSPVFTRCRMKTDSPRHICVMYKLVYYFSGSASNRLLGSNRFEPAL
jgi:hypothetical protein